MISLIVRSFNGMNNIKFIPLFRSLSGENGMCMKEYSITHSSLFIQNSKFSFSPKFREIGGNGIRFNEFITKTPKIPFYI